MGARSHGPSDACRVPYSHAVRRRGEIRTGAARAGLRRAALALVAALALAPGCGSAPERPPDVLLLSVDTLRPDYLGLEGYDRPTSPFLDSLFASGFSFARAWSPIARTTPALASLLTGAYPHRTGVRTLNGTLGREVVSLAELLRERGYQTAAVVTNPVLVRKRGLARGFDVYDSAARRSDARTADSLLHHLETLDRTRPLFAWVHFFDPHVPYHPDPEIAAAFDPGYTGRYREHFGFEPRDGAGAGLFRAWPQDLHKREATLRNRLPDAVNAHVRRLYAGEIRAVDSAAQHLVEGMRRVVGKRLLIVVTADHGESLGEHDYYYDHGDYVYDAGTRVPLGFVLPHDHRLHGSGRCQDPASLVDVVPTLLELLDIPPDAVPPGQLEGRSLVGCLRGETLAPRPIFSESGDSWYPELVPRLVRNDVAGRFRSVTLDGWKLVWTPFQPREQEWELYDLGADPGETRDLYRPDHPRLPALRAALGAWLARASDTEAPPPPLSAGDRAALEALGYAP